MLSKNKIKIIHSLKHKKYRQIHNLYLAEGFKLVSHLMANNEACTDLYMSQNYSNVNFHFAKNKPFIHLCEKKNLKKISLMKTPADMIGVFQIKNNHQDKHKIQNQLSLVLDDIRDPGNLGTIIRSADWFGIDAIFCSENCVDLYNPKVIQSSMGAFANMDIFFVNIEKLIAQYKSEKFPVYGTFLEGDDIFSTSLSTKGFIVIGNEGKGISTNIERMISQRLYIPPAKCSVVSESLNVASASAIVCAEFRRQVIQNGMKA